MDSWQALSRALQIYSAEGNFAGFSARGDCRGGCAVLHAPWVRLAGDRDRCRRRYGRRPDSRRVDDYAATGEEFVFRDRAVDFAQGRGDDAGAGGGVRSGQAADSGDLSECGGVGPGNLRCGGGESCLLRNCGTEYRPRRGVTTGSNFAGSSEAAAGSDGPVQRTDPGANAADGLVTASAILAQVRAGIE